MAIDRRQFLQHAAVLLGAGLSGACTSAVLSRGAEEPLRTATTVLSAEERAALEAVVERILPRTDTPGALDAGVPDFIEFVLAEGYPEDAREAYRGSLRELDARARSVHGGSLATLAPVEQDALLTQVELTEFAAGSGAPALFGGISPTKPFFAASKELTLVGYYTSRVGMAAERTYSHFPGAFDGAVEWSPGQKPWAGRP
jgi:hypothetical protein